MTRHLQAALLLLLTLVVNAVDPHSLRRGSELLAEDPSRLLMTSGNDCTQVSGTCTSSADCCSGVCDMSRRLGTGLGADEPVYYGSGGVPQKKSPPAVDSRSKGVAKLGSTTSKGKGKGKGGVRMPAPKGSTGSITSGKGKGGSTASISKGTTSKKQPKVKGDGMNRSKLMRSKNVKGSSSSKGGASNQGSYSGSAVNINGTSGQDNQGDDDSSSNNAVDEVSVGVCIAKRTPPPAPRPTPKPTSKPTPKPSRAPIAQVATCANQGGECETDASCCGSLTCFANDDSEVTYCG